MILNNLSSQRSRSISRAALTVKISDTIQLPPAILLRDRQPLRIIQSFKTFRETLRRHKQVLNDRRNPHLTTNLRRRLHRIYLSQNRLHPVKIIRHINFSRIQPLLLAPRKHECQYHRSRHPYNSTGQCLCPAALFTWFQDIARLGKSLHSPFPLM